MLLGFVRASGSMRTRETTSIRGVRIALAALVAAGFLGVPAAATWGEEPHPKGSPGPSGETCEDAPTAPALPSWVWMGFIGLGTVGVGGTAFALRTLWWPPARGLAGPAAAGGFFARLTRRDVESHPARARVLEAVAANPGVPAARLAELLAINVGTLDYHLTVLERDGRIRAVRSGRDRLVFPAGAVMDEGGLSVLAAPGRGDVADIVKREPGLFVAAIAQRLGVQPPTVHHHLKILEASGLVRIERGARARCFPTERLLATSIPPRRRRTAILFDEDQKNT